MLSLLACCALSATGSGQDGLLKATPAVFGPGVVRCAVALPPTHSFWLFVATGGAVSLPGIVGPCRLTGPTALFGTGRGSASFALPIPPLVPATRLWFQAVVAGPAGAFCSDVEPSVVLAVALDRRSPPRASQAAATVNVGQHVELRARLEPSEFASGASWSWSVAGPHVRDYTDDPSVAFRVVPMQPADYLGSALELYWLPDPGQVHPNPGTAIARTVSVGGMLGERPGRNGVRDVRRQATVVAEEVAVPDDLRSARREQEPVVGQVPVRVIAAWPDADTSHRDTVLLVTVIADPPP
jgi:hypothetical protein